MTRPDTPHVGQPHSINAARTMLENLLMSSDTPGEGVTNPQARLLSDEQGQPTTTKVNPSSWIDKVKYKNGFLAVFLKRQDRKDEPVVLLYSNVPSWMCGLIQAGEGGQSIGSAYNSLLKRADVQTKYGIQYQRVEGEDAVRELKEMMQCGL